MSEPKTLMQLAGAEPRPFKLSESALIVIDAQREYLDGKLPLTGVEAALKQIATLLVAAREHGRPIVHVQHRGKPGGLFDPETRNFVLCDEAAALPGETVIEKALPNAFAGTGLDEALAGAGTKQLIICGFMTHMCVSSTVRAALDLGYGSTVVASACATRALPTVGGAALSADQLQEAELAALGDRFAMIAREAGEVIA